MSDNLPTLIQLERLMQEVGSGKLSLELVLNKGIAKGVSVFGSRKLLYNRSQVDQQNNEKAVEDVARRLFEAIKRGEHEHLEFAIKVSNGRVNYVEWHSKQQKVFDKPQE